MEYSVVSTQFIHVNYGEIVLTHNRRVWSKQENIGGETIHDAVMMGKVCHAIVDDMGDDKVFWEKNKKGKIYRIVRKYVHMVHIQLGVHKGP